MAKAARIVKIVFLSLMALFIPAMLVFDAIQARKYSDLRNQVIELEKKQADLIEENKKLITDISMLSSADRIERIASEELNMRKAESDEIIRVEMRDAGNGSGN
ncbi:MAG TPA: cell division protein FtsL [Treponema sp.]|jgi:cell division protein FtsL|nr:cell division protein FtsL [Treponema sp.]HAK69282.1 cell division protein FtsL [Treponema sp.]HBB42001.1 cell division protein FtsL [Treponema sp.]HCA19937.1 cell division protein FtsL [Treponema sp.]